MPLQERFLLPITNNEKTCSFKTFINTKLLKNNEFIKLVHKDFIKCNEYITEIKKL